MAEAWFWFTAAVAAAAVAATEADGEVVTGAAGSVDVWAAVTGDTVVATC